jgi:hypothetical protein
VTAGQIVFDPLLAWPLVWAAAALMAAVVALAVWRGLSGWWLRALAAMSLLVALANPSLQQEEREPLSDIVLMVVDETASQRISDRPAQTAQAVADVTAAVAALPNTELRTVVLKDAEGDGGSLLMGALAEAMADEPRARLAGAILVSDGQLHDIEAAPDLPAPLHLLMTGHSDDWDRRLVIASAPAFAIMGEPVTLTLRVEDQGAAPVAQSGLTEMTVSIDGGEPLVFQVPVGQDIDLPVTLPHGGLNVIQFQLPMAEGELTDRNNAAVVQINGVRDRLRVLLVSGEPHAGERTWRNLLKSDSAVDLVHFTILRPPEKQDGVPVTELSLIAFPTRELFVDKIAEFDLIIFDRYKLRGILPNVYLDNVRQYVENGGAVLVASGPEYATVESLYRSPLGDILPAAPTSLVLDAPYKPRISEIGQRHPVTEGLEAHAPGVADEDGPGWGRWFRLVEVEPTAGVTVMEGIDDKPLLQLALVGQGRVALMASDQAWLWSRGYEGGGPQLELLRRLAHWMMKEPDLEEEALTATASGQTMHIVRRSLEEGDRQVEITGPDGAVQVLPMTEESPGRFVASYAAPEIGLYRLTEGELSAVVALGPSAPKEFEETIATGDKLEPLIDTVRGGVLSIEDGAPTIRRVAAGRPAAGRGWFGITPREAYLTADVTVTPLVRAWAFLALASLLIVGAWLLEGRRGERPATA